MSNDKKNKTGQLDFEPYPDEIDWEYALAIDEEDIDLNVDELFKNACRDLEAAGKRAQESFDKMGKTMGLTRSPFNFAETPDELFKRDPEAYQRAKEQLAQDSRLATKKGAQNGAE